MKAAWSEFKADLRRLTWDELDEYVWALCFMTAAWLLALTCVVHGIR